MRRKYIENEEQNLIMKLSVNSVEPIIGQVVDGVKEMPKVNSRYEQDAETAIVKEEGKNKHIFKR